MSDTNLDTNVQTTVATTTTNTPNSAPSINVEDLLAKVRAEEKGKLYPEIEKLKADVNAKIERINTLMLSVAEKEEQNSALNKEIEKLKKDLESEKAEGAKSKVESKEFKELNEKVAKLEKDLADKEATIAKIEAEKESMKLQAELTSYRGEKIKDLDESVQDLVFGNSKEEIDATFEKAKTAYEKLTNKFGKIPTMPKPGVSTHANTADFKNLTPDQIRALGADPKKWKEFRESMGLK